MSNKITEEFFTVECFANGEAVEFRRGWAVHASPGHTLRIECETLDEARAEMREIRRDFFTRDGGEYDRIADEQGAAAADAALAEFVESGSVCDDLNFYGIRRWERFAIGGWKVAEILADREGEDFAATVDALDRFGVAVDYVDFRDVGTEDAREDAEEANREALGDSIENAVRFLEVCDA